MKFEIKESQLKYVFTKEIGPQPPSTFGSQDYTACYTRRPLLSVTLSV